MPAQAFRCLRCVAILVTFGLATFSQTTISTGSILGTVSDPSGAAVAHATVTIVNESTGQKIALTSNPEGIYNSGGLIPGDYTVRVEAPGFSTSRLNVTVEVGRTSNGNLTLQLGQASQVVEVTGTPAAINPDQATVQGVLTAEQIDSCR
jgi:hypothetical protein